MGDPELPEDRVTPHHRGVEPLLDGLLSSEDVLQFEFDGLANLDVVAEAEAPAVRGRRGVEQLAHAWPLLGVLHVEGALLQVIEGRLGNRHIARGGRPPHLLARLGEELQELRDALVIPGRVPP